MKAPQAITIVGGGLAGLTLGIGLRRKGIPVAIREAGHYPRHRVCGEFISGRGLQTLDRLGLLEKLLTAGAKPAVNAAFFASEATEDVTAADDDTALYTEVEDVFHLPGQPVGLVDATYLRVAKARAQHAQLAF